jgi:excisionase family DNA binding protein
MSALVAAILDELRADKDARRELRELLGEREPGGHRLLSPIEAATRLGVHPKTLTRAAAAGRVAGARRVGRHWRFDPEALALHPPGGASRAAPVVARLPSHAGRSAADAIRRSTRPGRS